MTMQLDPLPPPEKIHPGNGACVDVEGWLLVPAAENGVSAIDGVCPDPHGAESFRPWLETLDDFKRGIMMHRLPGNQEETRGNCSLPTCRRTRPGERSAAGCRTSPASTAVTSRRTARPTGRAAAKGQGPQAEAPTC